MITDKIVKGAGSHRILMSLRERPRTSKDLKRVVGAINSVRRFDDEYMGRLLANGYVCFDGVTWLITIKGAQKCADLGDPEKPNSPVRRLSKFQTAVAEHPPVLRRDAMDFAQWPSRRGNLLFYRDGRVEKVE